MCSNISFSQSTPIEQIRKQVYENIKELRPDADESFLQEATDDLIRKSFGWLNCPAVQMRIEPFNCIFCPYGHMTECHYPLDCEQANCSHMNKYGGQ